MASSKLVRTAVMTAAPCSLLSFRRDVAAGLRQGVLLAGCPRIRRYKLKGAAMSTNLFVGNLAFATTNRELETMFAEYGEVTSAQVITDRDTGRSRGFGFVEMASSDSAEKAISSLDGRDISGRQIKVNVAKARSR
jgi:cold-inducible RNA-binding protein